MEATEILFRGNCEVCGFYADCPTVRIKKFFYSCFFASFFQRRKTSPLQKAHPIALTGWDERVKD
ncbi:MAG: hypothetical protein BHW37_06580 [Firmicutes bacterium CAG:272_52_7]|nr:MAG: hypothetical protein BHW37_06580 [Firmicutes bacterium CAG:272_52_7]